MPKVRVELDKSETVEEAEELLFKALSAQRSGDLHDGKFHDPAMEDLSIRLAAMHEAEFEVMLREIYEAIEKEYEPNGNV